MNRNNFESLGLSNDMLKSIKQKGFEEPTEIQSKIIPLILENKADLVGQAQTGTGKTAAFALPILEMLQPNAKKLQALILVPTRELAIQVSDEINSLRGSKNVHVAPIYGGQSYETQFRRLNKGVDIIVGTPGRIIDHLNRKSLIVDSVSFVVLDEADEMLNMGFIDDIEDILSRTNEHRRTLLFSATMPPRIMELAKRYMGKHEIVRTKKSGQTTDLTEQKYFEVKEADKFDSLCRIIDTTVEFYGLVFCRTKTDVDSVTSRLLDRGYDAEGLHGDISQNIREKILGKFRKKQVNILAATDVAARGLDIDELTHVINYSLPHDPESYLHRIGRTGRAGREGTAITFVTPEEFRKLKFIKTITQTEIRKERVPQIKEVIDFKKTKILNEVNSLIEYGTGANYIKLAEELLLHNRVEEVVAALLKYNFQNELEESSYARIQDLFDRSKEISYDERKGKGDRRDRKREGRGERSEKGQRFERFGSFDRKDKGDRAIRSDRYEKSDRFDRKERKDRNDRDGDRRDWKERGGRSSGFEEKGKARMFLALGRKDELDEKGLLKMLKKKTGLDQEKFTGVRLSDAFSFFNVSNKDAEIVLSSLNKDKSKRPLVEKAKSVK
ncbi:MAG: ATP-dependent RNA helicase DeaD [Ignavibacteria bacterium]|nr:MAG: ATP-dependent RNA helicase DeaD [Ignavibacteria bacterium]KAF0162467.1 MAG: ATP-dependent RNA helicase DeaD [Ignavibacteria bacterium]